MAADELFEDLPEQARPQADAPPLGAPRLREPQRDQIALRAVDIESLIGEDHPARLIWSYVEELDLSELENRIKARGDRPGHPATSPRLLLALWLYATSDGVGSARALERLCENHDAYRWLCGGVSVNYHMLADFRVGCADLLDRLLSEHLAALAKAGLIDLATLAQDGVRVRASAGAASFRRRPGHPCGPAGDRRPHRLGAARRARPPDAHRAGLTNSFFKHRISYMNYTATETHWWM